MRRRPHLAAAAAAAFALSACGGTRPNTSTLVMPTAGTELERFGSQADLTAYLQQIADVQEERRRQEIAAYESQGGEGDADGEVMMEAAPASGEASCASAASTAADDAGGSESITNTQEVGVDEGGIVKTHGEHLVVLRRGRLFSIDTRGGALRPIARIDAFPPNANGSDAWYDEMLIHEDRIVVIGYSYAFESTEIGLFDIDAEGRFTHVATHYLRSNDYYSSRNYASRLVDGKLVFYMPHYLFAHSYQDDGTYEIEPQYPSVGQWQGPDQRPSFHSIVRGREVYRPIQATEMPTLHTVVTCDLEGADFGCRARGIVGPPSRAFYVSSDAVYVWVSGETQVVQGQATGSSGAAFRASPANDTNAVVYRLPLDGGTPGALRAFGAPIDQFSFKEANGFLNVVLQGAGGGDAMWAPEGSDGGPLAMMRVPVSTFALSASTVADVAYARLPRPRGYTLQNRFVGDHLLYGSGSSWDYEEQNREDRVFVYPYVQGGPVTRLELEHGVDRIEVMQPGAVVIGQGGGALHFSSIELAGEPSVESTYEQAGASQGETRSHGFFYKPEDADSGVLGLPIRSAQSPGWSQLIEGSASVAYLRVEDLELTPIGTLGAAQSGAVDDRCVASCVDWYGNARPIFYRGRVFALLGYELVEGRLDGDHIVEAARTNFFNTTPRRFIMTSR